MSGCVCVCVCVCRAGCWVVSEMGLWRERLVCVLVCVYVWTEVDCGYGEENEGMWKEI